MSRFLIGKRFNNSIASLTPSATGSGITVANQAALSPTAALTLEAWIYPFSPYPALSANIIFDNTDTGVSNSYFLAVLPNGTIEFIASFGGTIKSLISSNSVPSNAWSLVELTWDGTTVKIFINSVQDPTTLAASGAMGTSAQVLRIGQYLASGLATFGFYGYMTGMRVYSRGLTSTDVANRYFSNTNTSTMRIGLQLEYNLVTNTGTSIPDTSGNGFTGTYSTNSWSNTQIPFNARNAVSGRVRVSGRVPVSGRVRTGN